MAAFASATLLAAALLAPHAGGSMLIEVVAVLLVLAHGLGWMALLAWHGFGRGKPPKPAPLLRLWRR